MRTIAVINRKGGSGKTTTAVCLAAELAGRGLPTLLIDLDPQGSASAWLAEVSEDRGLYDALLGTRDLGSIAIGTEVHGLQLIRSSPWLLKAEQSMMGDIGAGVLRAIRRLHENWAFVIVDCPPSLSYLSVGALMAVREVIIPVEAHSIALRGAEAVVREIRRIQSTLNPTLRDPLIVACRVNRTNHARDVLEVLGRVYGGNMADATIRESIRLAEAEAAGMPIAEFAPDSGADRDFRSLAAELIERDATPEPPRRESRWRHLFSRSATATR